MDTQVNLRRQTAFLGNHFLQVLGENFSAHSVTNPDQASERKLLEQLAPELSKDMILRLVGVFQDLRKGYDSGVLNYPYSLRGMENKIGRALVRAADTTCEQN